ncbi:MAG: outer membrane beta-barrel protein [Rhodospirillales bacterium]|nr:outer membrane beta-barrel protein [Rhodospirillales bacterium]
MKKSKVAALLAVAPWALVATTAVAVAQVKNPLPPGSVPLPAQGGASPGNAQQVTVLPRGDTVATRARPEYDPLGIRAGSFLFFPQLSVSEVYNDNIFATDGGKVDDFITVLSPQATLESNWSRHALAIAGGGDFSFYKQNPDEDYQDWFAATDGRIDVSRDIALYGGGGAARRHEIRGSPDDPGGDEPTVYYEYNAFARYDQNFDRFGLTVDGLFDRVDYTNTPVSDGPDISNNDRDRNVYSTPVRLGYEITPDYEAFVRVAPNIRRYDQTPDFDGVDRDSWGYQAVGGLALDFGGITFGEIYAGYMQQFYDDSDLNNVNTPTFGGSVTWNATTLTTLNLAVERNVLETTAIGASSYISTSGELTIDHELLRNVILTAGGAVTNNDYDGINRKDWFYLGNFGARYLLNRNLYLSAGYLYRHRSSTGSDGVDDFTQNLIRIGLQTQL